MARDKSKREEELAGTGGESETEGTANADGDKGSPADGEDSPNNQSDGPEAGKEAAPEITEKDLEEFGNKSVETALEQQRDAQKTAFHKLIEENVKLSRAKQRAEVDLHEMVTRYDLKIIELDDEKTKSETLEEKMKLMGKDIKLMAMAAKQAGRAPRKRTSTLTDGETTANEAPESQPPPDDNENQNNNRASKIKDLQQRLIRLAHDDEEKDKHIKSLTDDRDELKTLLAEMEEHLGPERMARIKAESENRKRVDETNTVYAPGVTYSSAESAQGATHRNKSGGVQESKVCTIM